MRSGTRRNFGPQSRRRSALFEFAEGLPDPPAQPLYILLRNGHCQPGDEAEDRRGRIDEAPEPGAGVQQGRVGRGVSSGGGWRAGGGIGSRRGGPQPPTGIGPDDRCVVERVVFFHPINP